jgi:hypothetical protein
MVNRLAVGEHLEDVCKHLGRDADARVAHVEDELAMVLSGSQRDSPARLGVLDGVTQQVPEYLFQPGRVSVQQDWLPGERSHQFMPPLACRGADRLDDPGNGAEGATYFLAPRNRGWPLSPIFRPLDGSTMNSAVRQCPQRYRAWAATLARSAFGMRDRLMTSRPDPKDHDPAASRSLLHVRE